MKNDFTKNVIMTVLGGIGLFFATILLNAFTSSPPTRAEFIELKTDTTRHLKSIDDKLKVLKDGQDRILDHLLER